MSIASILRTKLSLDAEKNWHQNSGANRRDVFGVDQHAGRRGDNEMEGSVHDAAAACLERSGACAAACEAASFSRASSSVPTM